MSVKLFAIYIIIDLLYNLDKYTCFFFISIGFFFQLSLSIAFLFNELSFVSSFSVACYIKALSYRNMLCFVYFSLCLHLGLFTSYLIYVIYFFIVISIFITIKDITSLTQANLFFEHVCHKFSLMVLLSFCLIFCQFQSGVAY